jgi:hypothetical protein
MNQPDVKFNFGIPAMILGVASLFLTAIMGKSGTGLTLPVGILMVLLEFLYHFRKHRWFNPYYLMILSPLNLIRYATIGDFQIRLVCFLALVYIVTIATVPGTRKIPAAASQLKSIYIWLLALLIFSSSATALYLKGVHLSGDEPHYLMIAQSIVEDGDFDLSNNLENRTYTRYLPVEIPLHGKIYRGKAVSYHMPGVSFLLVPFYALFILLNSLIPAPLFFRLVASLISAFFALGLFTLLKQQFPEKKIFGLWLLFLCLYPLIFHAVHLYPELPAAALMMWAFIFFFGEKKKPWLSGLLISLVAWFHVKYYPALIALSVIMILSMIKRKQWKSLGQFFIFPLANLLLLLIYTRTLYGSFNPAAIFPGENYFLAPLALRIKVLLAYFLDQRDGLLFYSPLFFLLFFGFKAKIKSQKVFLWISIPYLVFHAFTTVRGAYSPAGRPLMFVSWIFMVWIAGFYFHQPHDNSRTGFRILTGFNVFVLIWLFYYPLFMYQPVFSQTLERATSWLMFLGSSVMAIWRFFPSFLTRNPGPHPANIIWIGLMVLLIGLYYGKRSLPRLVEKYRELLLTLLFLVLSFVFCFNPHVHLIPGNRHADGHIALYNNSKNFRYIEDLKGFNILAGQTYRIFLEPGTHSLTFLFRNTDKIQVKVHNKTRLLFQSRGRFSDQFSVSQSSLKTLKIKRKTIIPLEITTRTREAQSFLFMQII